MNDKEISADYLIVGAGAMGMAFADVVLSHGDASIVIVDRYDKPGGHWNHAYPFVRLHQPSNFYGVNSRKLGEDRVDQAGRNKGMMELAGVNEILGYFDNVMRRDFLPSGRVKYFPQCEYLGADDGVAQIRSVAGGESFYVRAGKIVDATYMNVQVPQTTPPRFEVDEGVQIAPPNRLAALDQSYDNFVIVGAGKTAFDACLYLMDLGVDPDRIIWIKPRESWLLDREKLQPEGFGGMSLMQNMLDQNLAVAESTSLGDMFDRLESCGWLLRIDPQLEPSMYRCATVSRAELADLRRIKNVIRRGRVTRLAPGRIILEQGEAPCPQNSLFVNCTADGLERRPRTPVFEGQRITLQAVRPCQQLFSAAMIGFVERHIEDEARRNELCAPTPHPDSLADYLTFVQDSLRGQLLWAQEPKLFEWLIESRLDAMTTPGFAELLNGKGPMPVEALMDVADAVMAKSNAYLQELGANRG